MDLEAPNTHGFAEHGHDDSECVQAPGRADSRVSLGAISCEVMQDWGKESWRKVVTESLGNHRVISWSLVLGLRSVGWILMLNQ